MIVAHKTEDGRLQSFEQHAQCTAEQAEAFAASFGCGGLGKCLGLFHDMGKCHPAFQDRILRNGPKVEHAAAGAMVFEDMNNRIARILSYCIAGHHTGLPDGGSKVDTTDGATLMSKIKRQKQIDFDFAPFYPTPTPEAAFVNGIGQIKPLDKAGFSLSFLVRMLFSALKDADCLDTEAFMNPERKRPTGESIEALREKLFVYMERFSNPTRTIDKKRCEIREACTEKAALPRGLFSLTVPTGGGKTLSSLTFALEHANTHGMSRIIYAIPYTSIIEQNAKVFRDVLGAENVLEHHSGMDWDEKDEDMHPMRLASENWDMPVIVTTNVQLFESLFHHKTSRCRKLHNIANSVIILDEAQMLPIEYLLPCLRALGELMVNYGCTVVLCTATQPGLHRYFPGQSALQPVEICENYEELFQFFRRASIRNIGEITKENLVERMKENAQGLCIVNSRKLAKEIYEMLPAEGRFHLSTLMIAPHRRDIIAEIKKRLKKGLPCRVVSTSLIEAGVDIDFPVVFRQEAGIDSQIQAAGRCNREGERPLEESVVSVFTLAETAGKRIPKGLQYPINAARAVARNNPDISSPDAILAYFHALYKSKGPGELDKKGIIGALEEGFRNGMLFPFATISDNMKLIESDTKAVMVPWDEEGKTIASEMVINGLSRQMLRLAGRYVVQVYNDEFERLYQNGRMRLVQGSEKYGILSDISQYSEETGLLSQDTGIGLFA